jgi:hypothetical protein
MVQWQVQGIFPVHTRMEVVDSNAKRQAFLVLEGKHESEINRGEFGGSWNGCKVLYIERIQLGVEDIADAP